MLANGTDAASRLTLVKWALDVVKLDSGHPTQEKAELNK